MPQTIIAHESYLYQVFQNLIKNAIKFQDDGNIPEIQIMYKNARSYHQFEVIDNGIGIAEEYFERIFLIFSRLNKREMYEGSGIGLALCKKVIELHNGKIWLESEKGEGTTFFFTIAKKPRLPS